MMYGSQDSQRGQQAAQEHSVSGKTNAAGHLEGTEKTGR